jgi:DNA processing protein
MTDACDWCLRRSHLIGFLAGDVQRLLPPGGPARAEVLDADSETLLAAVSKPRQSEARAMLRSFKPGGARAAAQDAGIDLACEHAERYPTLLRELRRPPPVLYTTNLSVTEGGAPAAAVIGSRRPSEYGRSVAYSLARGLGSAGVPVVSGLALGIDAIAHRGCLDAEGTTVAVLASGVDVAYPRTNRGLYDRIRKAGSIVSEMPPGSRPYRWLFPARNRIMAALGQVTVVVEAADRSGTLITADCAADLGRDVAAVPGQVTSAAAAGTNALIRNGAALVEDAQDVLDLMYGVGVREVPAEPVPALAPAERRVLDLIGRGAGLEELGREAGLTAAAVRAQLARLELRGFVRRAPSGAYVPIQR